jgi:hypothetical protein
MTEKVKNYFSINLSSIEPNEFNRELLKGLSHIESTAETEDMKDKNGFYNLRQDFLEKISSYVSKLMICLLLLEANVHPTFFTRKIAKYKTLLKTLRRNSDVGLSPVFSPKFRSFRLLFLFLT